jgi:CBS domain-containing protein
VRTAAELMPSNLWTVPHDEPLASCARLFLDRDIRHLPVVDDDGKLLGVATQEAVFRHGVLTGEPRIWMPLQESQPLAGEIAEPVQVRFAPDDPLEDVIEALANSTQDVGIAIDGGLPVGILTEHDLVWLAQWALPESLTIAGIASQPVRTIGRDTAVSAAWDRMREALSRHVVVVDGDTLYGVLSIRDLIAADVPRSEGRTAGDVCSRPVHTVEGEVAVCEAAGTMVSHRIGCLPVVDADCRPTKLVTRTDLLRAMVGRVQTPVAVQGEPPT